MVQGEAGRFHEIQSPYACENENLAEGQLSHRRPFAVGPGADPGAAGSFVFVDRGMTMYNNPALQMFLMAKLDRYRALKPDARWRPDADRMLIVSVGTGTSPDMRSGLEPDQMNLLFNATAMPSAMMFAALNEQARPSTARSTISSAAPDPYSKRKSSLPICATTPS